MRERYHPHDEGVYLGDYADYILVWFPQAGPEDEPEGAVHVLDTWVVDPLPEPDPRAEQLAEARASAQAAQVEVARLKRRLAKIKSAARTLLSGGDE